ncbi:MAG TPA: 50S ribosomal protein L11, partial [Chryseosolibacter sp.]|nr:50S ribosomal protein L11 [Chryseosolibacter sp.]
PPAAILILDAAKKQKGSAEPKTVKIGSITWDQVKTIAETKMPDLNAFRVEAAMKMIAGTARSLGITVSGTAPWEK